MFAALAVACSRGDEHTHKVGVEMLFLSSLHFASKFVRNGAIFVAQRHVWPRIIRECNCQVDPIPASSHSVPKPAEIVACASQCSLVQFHERHNVSHANRPLHPSPPSSISPMQYKNGEEVLLW